MPQCKGCNAAILWVEMKTGKKMPVDMIPLHVVQVKDGIGEVIEAYYPHWATCGKADQFRRKESIHGPGPD